MSISQSIFDFLQIIPENRVVTYASIAQKFHTHPRGVARILSSNANQDIYPCYKVICSDGKLGGYNLGIDEKIRRLQADDILIIKNNVPAQYIRNPLDNTT